MPTPLLGERPLTPAQRQARRHERLALAVAALRTIAEEARSVAQARRIAREALAAFPRPREG